MPEAANDQLAAEISRDLVSLLAPEELPIFKATSKEYFTHPQKVLKGQQGKDDMLGFGLGDAVPFMTPVVLAIMTEVVNFVWERVKEVAKQETESAIANTIKRMFKKGEANPDSETQPFQLSQEHIQRLHQLILGKAGQLKLTEDKALRLADSVVGKLTITGS